MAVTPTRTMEDYGKWLSDDEDWVPEENLAPPELVEFDLAVQELRDALDTIEGVDWTDEQEVKEAEEAIETLLPELQRDLHDALDSMRRERDV